MPEPQSHSISTEARPTGETRDRVRSSTEQLALADAWRAVDNAVRSIFELARSLELLSDAIQRLEADPAMEFREIENNRNRFQLE